MTTIMPEGENIRKAVKWISDMKKETPQTPMARFIDDACARFNLSPKETEYLCSAFGKTTSDKCV
ncbi:MAG: hypothetical protein V1753_04985 [Pseudomonadota bacterium]